MSKEKMTDDEKRAAIMRQWNVAIQCEKDVKSKNPRIRTLSRKMAPVSLKMCLWFQDAHPDAFGRDFKKKTQDKLNSWKKEEFG